MKEIMQTKIKLTYLIKVFIPDFLILKLKMYEYRANNTWILISSILKKNKLNFSILIKFYINGKGSLIIVSVKKQVIKRRIWKDEEGWEKKKIKIK